MQTQNFDDLNRLRGAAPEELQKVPLANKMKFRVRRRVKPSPGLRARVSG